jgi:branched-chain amino acid transport system substrate-binding protein
VTTVRAALVTPLSGPLAEYGRAGAIALGLWADQSAVELTVLDTHPDPTRAVTAAERTRPDLLFGPYGSGPAARVLSATDRLVWNHGGAGVDPGATVVNVLAPATTYFAGVIRAVHDADPSLRTVSVLHGDTGFGRAVADGAIREAERLGLHVSRTVWPGEPAAGDLLLVAGRFADELAAANHLLPGRWRAVGFVGAGVEEVLAELGEDRGGLLGPSQWQSDAAPLPDLGPTAAEFTTLYQGKAAGPPPYPAAQAFAAGLIAARCLHDAGTTDDRAMADAARALDRTTMFARFRLDPRTGTQIGHRMLVVQWQDGARRVVWPPERAQAPLRYPRRADRSRQPPPRPLDTSVHSASWMWCGI